MQPGAEYLVILNDRPLRDACIERHQREVRSMRHRQDGGSSGATAWIAQTLMATRHILLRFRHLTRNASPYASTAHAASETAES